MIKLIFGNVGSGKTASMVRYMRNNPHKKFITNIDVKGRNFKHVIKLKANMIIKREIIGHKRNGDENCKLSLNTKFWKDLINKEGEMNIIIDEAHIFLNPRRSMSKLNIIMSDFIALLRRVLGSQDTNGELILITQLSRRLDIIAKEMATDVTYCIHHYNKRCKCGYAWHETNETSNKLFNCPNCNNYNVKKCNSLIEVLEFKQVDGFNEWKNYGTKSYYKRYIIKDIETIFGNYDTLQFEDLMAEY